MGIQKDTSSQDDSSERWLTAGKMPTLLVFALVTVVVRLGRDIDQAGPFQGSQIFGSTAVTPWCE